jgi:hypothetical protein
MYLPFTIKELLQNILSYIPKSIIIPCALVSKDFYNTIEIDYDQESVAKNSDMFSLLKIIYSPKVVLNIATLHNNIVMVDYLLCKHGYEYIEDDDILCRNIGFMGNDYLLEKIKEKHNFSLAIIGMCEGGYTELFEKYKNSYDICYTGDELLIAAYKSGSFKMPNTVKKYMNDKSSLFDSWIDGTQLKDAEITGKCAIKDSDYVLNFIQTIIVDKKDDLENKYRKGDIIFTICDGLMMGEHYDILVWLFETLDDAWYTCEMNESILNLIIKNNYKMLTLVLSKYCYRFLIDGHLLFGPEWSPEEPINYPELVMYCIDYKRVDMMIFILDLIRFNMERYQTFLDKAKSLKFTDIEAILVLNLHLFDDYREW